MAKPLGTKSLRIRQAPNKEWGVWRVNDEGCPYLLLTEPEVEAAIELGEKMGKALNLLLKIDRSTYYE